MRGLELPRTLHQLELLGENIENPLLVINQLQGLRELRAFSVNAKLFGQVHPDIHSAVEVLSERRQEGFRLGIEVDQAKVDKDVREKVRKIAERKKIRVCLKGCKQSSLKEVLEEIDKGLAERSVVEGKQ